MSIKVPSEVKSAQVIFVNHSGGKDSQAMLAALQNIGFKGRLVIVHSDLGEMEWEPMHDFIEKNSFGLELHIVKPELSFFDLCRKYSRLPSGQARFCTSELKRKPITEFIRKYCAEHGFTRIINAIGIRAEESPSRAKKNPFEVSDVSIKYKTKADKAAHGEYKLLCHDWYPIFDYKLGDVWFEIKKAGQQPHAVYTRGYSRLSCVFCVYGRIEEHKKAAKERPELYGKMVALEKELGKTIRLRQVNGKKINKFMDEYCGEAA